MTTFDNREQGFEKKFALDAEQAFKARARRNKLLGQWAAAKLGKTGADADAYATEVAVADLDAPGDDDFIHKILKDFAAHNVAVDESAIRAESAQLFAQVAKELKGA